MRSFQEKRRWRNILESWPVLVILVFLLFLFLWSVIDFYRKMNLTEDNKEQARLEVNELKDKKEKLGEDIKKLKSEEGKEEIFRENYGLAKEGEGLVVVVDDKTVPEATKEKKGNWFTSWFGSWFD